MMFMEQHCAAVPHCSDTKVHFLFPRHQQIAWGTLPSRKFMPEMITKASDAHSSPKGQRSKGPKGPNETIELASGALFAISGHPSVNYVENFSIK